MGDFIVSGSAFENQRMTVDQMLADPTFIPQRILNNLDGSFLFDYILRDAGSNQGVVAYREQVSAYLEDDAEPLAEFAEIPVSDPILGQLHSVIGVKHAEGIRISRDMLTKNKIDQVQLRVDALQKTIMRKFIRLGLNAFSKAPIQEMNVSAQWNKSADIAGDLLNAVEMIQGAKAPDAGENAYFDYQPNVLIAAPVTVTKIIRNDDMQKRYIGDVAHDNPLYRGMQNIKLFGMLDVAESRFLKPDELYILEAGTCGFYSDADPLQATPIYEEGGNSGAGGPRQTWRADIWRETCYGIDNPKAVVKLKGIM